MINKRNFSIEIENIARTFKIPYMDAVLHYCDENGMEVEVAAQLINRKIKETIESEASDLNMMKEKINRLPV